MESTRVDKSHTDMGTPPSVGEPTQDTPPPRVRYLIYGETLQPTTNRYPTRSRDLKMLLYGKPEPLTQQPYGIPSYFLNNIINDDTGEVRANSLQLNVVIDLTTGEKREYRHLIIDLVTGKNGIHQ